MNATSSAAGVGGRRECGIECDRVLGRHHAQRCDEDLELAVEVIMHEPRRQSTLEAVLCHDGQQPRTSARDGRRYSSAGP